MVHSLSSGNDHGASSCSSVGEVNVGEVHRSDADGAYPSIETQNYRDLVSIVIGLEWTGLLDTQVRSLGFSQLGHFHAELLKVQSGDFFV